MASLYAAQEALDRDDLVDFAALSTQDEANVEALGGATREVDNGGVLIPAVHGEDSP